MPAASTLAAVVLLTLTGPAAPQPVLTLQDPALVESSGLAVSALHDGVLWTHADGGSVAQVRAVDPSGRTVAVVTLAGIDPYDPEALAPATAPDGTPELYLGDIGDNSVARPDVSVFRLAEPRSLREETVPARWYRFTYPDGPHDAEALLVHPRTGRILIVTKDLAGAGLYRAPASLVTKDAGTNRLERVADAPSLVTDGAFLPDGRIVLRTYTSVYVYDRPGHQVAVAPLPPQPQGESLAVDGDRLLVGSEGEDPAVYAVPVPQPEPSPAPSPSAVPPGPDPAWWQGTPAGALALLVGAALLAAAVRRFRGRPRPGRG